MYFIKSTIDTLRVKRASHQCTVCNKVFQNYSQFVAHNKIHVKQEKLDNYFQCKLCDEKYEIYADLEKHCKTHVNEEKSVYYQCRHCEKRFRQNTDLEEHCKLHVKPEESLVKASILYQCSLCKKNFTQYCDLDKHVSQCNQAHSNNKHVSIINQPNSNDKSQSTISVNNGEQTLKSSTSTSINGSLKKNGVNSSREKLYKCSICEKSFWKSDNLIKHTTSHIREKLFKCGVCDKTFRESRNLIKHTRIHVKDKPYKCDVCSKSFRESRNLIEHTRIHVKDKPYKCDVCSKSFCDNDNLLKHIQSHMKQRLKKCDVCSKSFLDTDKLLKHTRSHTREKVYECDVCSQSFSTNAGLQKHIKIHKELKTADETIQVDFQEGDRIDALWPPDGNWYSATILEMSKDKNKFHVCYSNDKILKWLICDQVRPASSVEDSYSNLNMSKSDDSQVEADDLRVQYKVEGFDLLSVTSEENLVEPIVERSVIKSVNEPTSESVKLELITNESASGSIKLEPITNESEQIRNESEPESVALEPITNESELELIKFELITEDSMYNLVNLVSVSEELHVGSDESVEPRSFSVSPTEVSTFTSNIPQGSRVAKNTHITVFATNNTDGRKWDKRQYCYYCRKPQSKLPRHLYKIHTTESEVRKIIQTMDPHQKTNLLSKIRNLGNHKHNCEVLRKNEGCLIVAYRPSNMTKVNPNDYCPCVHCYGYYMRKELWKHKCFFKTSSKRKLEDDDPNESTESHKIRKRVYRDSQLLKPALAGVSEALNDLLAPMKPDEISQIVKNDNIIIELAKREYLGAGYDVNQFNYIRSKLREIGRLLYFLRENDDNQKACLEDYINPQNLSKVVTALRNVAGFKSDTNQFATPSLALKIGHTLKKCAMIVMANALENGDMDKVEQTQNFHNLCELKWSVEIPSHCLNLKGHMEDIHGSVKK
ncbi:uncharacterized protein LOC126816141 isoform X5 [Patella vulgata]|uniref:uncharacterized protein LOC126816141 isoform X5 n=1 Tax=Patella vulgata TaxID=6465 RepID=UPI00217F774B|nr:uncharacterized protein LOC126816141 isoform X5 [Patella vulgata]